MTTTKSEVRRDFTHARYLMRLADAKMKSATSATDWSNDGDIGQIANELIACVVTFAQFVEEKRSESEI